MRSFEELTREAVRNLHNDGYAVIESFLSDDDVIELKKESSRLVEEYKEEKQNIYGTRDRYFLNSSNNISFFFEKEALDNTGHLSTSSDQSVAKIGHALHFLNPSFKKFTKNHNTQFLFKEIGFENPTVVQSMVIFKNPHVGGAYTPHQDASFMFTEPEIRLIGIWYALNDATVENGCLEFIPGSHNWRLKRRFVLNGKDTGDLITWTSPEVEYNDDQFVKVPVKKGTAVIIHGLVVHRSSRNKSDFPRQAYTFHVIDSTEKSRYSKDNWLQICNQPNTFMPLYDL